MRAAILTLAVAGCSAAPIEVQLRVPVGDHPLAGADQVLATVRDGAGQLLAFARGSAGASSLRLPGVAAGNSYTVEVDASFGADVIARGRSCRFDVDAARPPTVPIWFSHIGRFAPTAALRVARSDAAAFAWQGGALVAGGNGGAGALASSERYDPPSASFRDGPMLSTPRAGARVVDIGGGTVLIIGGAAAGAPALEALSASHTTPEPAGLSPSLVEHAAAQVGDGSVLIAGGRVAGAPSDGAWVATQAAAVVDALPAMAHARARLTLTAVSGDPFAPLFVVGGVDATAPVAEIEAYDPASRSFFLPGIKLVVARADHTVTRLPSGLLLVVGGVDASGAPTATAELIDPVGRGARVVATMRTARARHAATLLASGRVLITGGVDGSGAPVAAAEIFDPAVGAEGDFVPTAPLGSARAGHALVPLCDGTFLVAGGGDGNEIYNPL